MSELKPCPFCGGDAEFGEVPYERKYAGDNDCRINHDHGGQFIQCKSSDCSASSMLIFPTMADAKPLLIEKWNRRAPSDQPADAVVVPIETLILMRKAITYDAPYSNAAIMAYDKLKESHAMLRAAQEGK